MIERLHCSFPQPFVGAATMVAALIGLCLTWVLTPSVLSPHDPVYVFSLGLCLTAFVVLAYRFPIHVRRKTRIYVETVPLFLMAVLLPPPLAVVSAGAGKLGGEMIVRRQTGNYPSDVASQVGRWMLTVLAGSLVAHGPWPRQPAALIGAAVALLLGDVITSPLLLGPITHEWPIAIVRRVAREAGPAETAQYLVGILGALAIFQARWALALIVLPIGLMYLAFKTAKDMHEHTRQLMASVVEASPDAILLLDTGGEIILVNRQAAALLGYATPEELASKSVLAIFGDDRERAAADMRQVFSLGSVPNVEYAIRRRDGTSFAGELSWAQVGDRKGHPRAITCVLRDITDRKQETEKLAHQAWHDGLTGLPNRLLFTERAEQAVVRARRDDTPLAVFLLDLNKFKQANDTYGHHYGDVILQTVGQRLQAVLRETDTVARLGGDEFAVLLPGTGDDGAHIVAGRIVDAIAHPILVDGLTLDIGISVGVALFGRDGRDAKTLLDRADAAMYQAKRAGGGYRLACGEELAS